MRISDWSSDVCSTDLQAQEDAPQRALAAAAFADQAERLAAPDGQVDAVGRLHQDARIAGHAAPEAAPRVVVLDQCPAFNERRHSGVSSGLPRAGAMPRPRRPPGKLRNGITADPPATASSEERRVGKA